MAPRNDRVTPSTEVRSPARSFLQNVDTFYQISRDRRGEQAIQQGVSALNSVLNERFEEYRADQRDDEFQQGVADAMREQAGEEMQGVQTGSLFRQNSRFYMAGLNETRGRSAAEQFRQETAAAYREWEDRDRDDDGSLFREWMNGRLAEFTNSLGDDRHRLAGALPTAQQVAYNLASSHASYTDRRIAAAAAAAARQAHTSNWTAALTGEQPLETAFLNSLGITEEHFDLEGAVANDTAIEGLIDASNFANDPSGLEFVEQAVREGRLRVNVEQAARISNGLESVRSDQAQEQNRINAQLEAEREAATQEALMLRFETVSNDPYAPLPSPEDFGGDFTAWNTAISMQNAIRTGSEQSNPMFSYAHTLELTAAAVDAPDLTTAINSISSVAVDMGPAGASQARQFLEETIEMARAENVIRNPLVVAQRQAFVDQVTDFETDEYALGQISTMRTRAEYLFNVGMAQAANNNEINPRNAVDVMQTAATVRENVTAQLVNEFPELTRERQEAQPRAAAVLGINEPIAQQDAEIAAQANAEAARIYAEQAAEAAAVYAGELSNRVETAIREAEATPQPFIVDPEEATGELFEDIPEPPARPPEASTRGPQRREWVDEALSGMEAQTLQSMTDAQLVLLEQRFNLPIGTLANLPRDGELIMSTLRYLLETQSE
jgi:hypothetical protein